MEQLLGYSNYSPYILKLKAGKGSFQKGAIVEASRVTYEDGTFDFILPDGWLVSLNECEVLSDPNAIIRSRSAHSTFTEPSDAIII
jgi:hypothetical protein